MINATHVMHTTVKQKRTGEVPENPDPDPGADADSTSHVHPPRHLVVLTPFFKIISSKV